MKGKWSPFPAKDTLMGVVEVGQYLVVDPRVCHGQLTFKGTRIPVDTALLYLAKGQTIDQIRASWPQLTAEAITEAIRLATAALLERYAYPPEAAREPIHPGRSA
jgi:uncharacterized protein (DUF433 family)